MNLVLATAALTLCLIPLVPPSSAVLAPPGCPTYDANQTIGPNTLHTNQAGQAQVDIAGGSFYAVFDDLDVEVDMEHFLNPAPSMRWIYDTTGVIEARTWLYQETNGFTGLQRYDWDCQTPGYTSATADYWF